MSLTTSDVIEIQQLYARYNTAIDTGDTQRFAACFIPNGQFDSGMSVIEGREGLAAFADQTHSAMPALRHNATNIVIEAESSEAPSTATGSAFLTAYLVDGGFKVIITGRYQDEFARTNEGWLFSKRVFRADS
jgi:actinorhodin biosynthesis protein ActVIA